jgi:hypothetical protein
MSCRASKKQIRSNPFSGYSSALATDKLTRSETPAASAFSIAASTEASCGSTPTNVEFGKGSQERKVRPRAT